jgi:hypothetical protein
MPWPMMATMNGAERKASGAILVSERQRPAHRVHVHLVERRLRERAAAVGVADQKRPAADRPVKLPVAEANCPVPLVTSQVSADVPLNRQLCGLIVNGPLPSVLMRWMVPPGKTRSHRLSGNSTTRPTPLNTPLATTTPLMTVPPENTMVALNVSLPLVAAAAGMAGAAEIASAVPAASSALSPVVSCFSLFAESAHYPSQRGQL